MDISARYTSLCAELGNLDIEIGVRERKREKIIAELELLQRLAAQMQHGAIDATSPTPINSAPDGSSTHPEG